MTATITTRTTAPPSGEGTAKGTPLTNLEMDSNLNSLISRSYASDTAGTAAFTVVDTYYELVSKGIKFVRIAAAPTSAGTAVSFNINGKGVKSLKFMDGAQVYDFHLREDDVLQLMYDGTDYIWLNPINRVLDFSSYSGADYQLRVGEAAKYSGSSVSSITLRLAAASGQQYRIKNDFSVTGTGDNSFLRINGAARTTLYQAVTTSDTLGASGVASSASSTSSSSTDLIISTGILQYNNVDVYCESGSTLSATTMAVATSTRYGITSIRTSQSVTITALTSIIAPSGQTLTGSILIERIA